VNALPAPAERPKMIHALQAALLTAGLQCDVMELLRGGFSYAELEAEFLNLMRRLRHRRRGAKQ
jgi:hypothetical protein